MVCCAQAHCACRLGKGVPQAASELGCCVAQGSIEADAAVDGSGGWDGVIQEVGGVLMNKKQLTVGPPQLMPQLFSSVSLAALLCSRPACAPRPLLRASRAALTDLIPWWQKGHLPSTVHGALAADRHGSRLLKETETVRQRSHMQTCVRHLVPIFKSHCQLELSTACNKRPLP